MYYSRRFGKRRQPGQKNSVRLLTLLLDNTFPSLVIHKDKRTSTERAQAKQAAPNPQIRIIAGLGHIHSDLFIMDIDCQSLVGNQFDGYGSGRL